MAGKQANILSHKQTDDFLVRFYYPQSTLQSHAGPVIAQSRFAGRGDRQPDLTDGFGRRRRNCPCNRGQGPRSNEGQRAIRFTPICAAPWSRWCKQAVRSVNWLTNVHFLASVQYPVTAIFRRRLRWVGRIDAGLRKRTAKLVGTRPSLSKRLGS